MDTELLRTFIEVNRTRHFGRAAANLYLTQSAVSARIRMLEELVGVSLFTRGRNDIQLTPEGQKLHKHAETILTAWNRARQEIAVEDEGKSSLNMAVVVGLATVLIDDWLLTFRRENADIVLNVEFLETATILKRLGEFTLDVALMFEATQSSSLRHEPLGDIRFVLVATTPELSSLEVVSKNYVLVNWGSWFTIAHAKSFPELPTPTLRLNSGRLARNLLLDQGGGAYLAESMVQADIDEGRLFRVEDADVIIRTAYALYPAESENRHTIEIALAALRDNEGVE